MASCARVSRRLSLRAVAVLAALLGATPGCGIFGPYDITVLNKSADAVSVDLDGARRLELGAHSRGDVTGVDRSAHELVVWVGGSRGILQIPALPDGAAVFACVIISPAGVSMDLSQCASGDLGLPDGG